MPQDEYNGPTLLHTLPAVRNRRHASGRPIIRRERRWPATGRRKNAVTSEIPWRARQPLKLFIISLILYKLNLIYNSNKNSKN